MRHEEDESADYWHEQRQTVSSPENVDDRDVEFSVCDINPKKLNAAAVPESVETSGVNLPEIADAPFFRKTTFIHRDTAMCRGARLGPSALFNNAAIWDLSL